MRRQPAFLFLLLVVLPWVGAAQPPPVGLEFQVNTYTTRGQYRPRIGMDPAGNFVVVWYSEYQDGSGTGIFGQRYDADGTPVGTETRINVYTTADQRSPDIALDRDGNFVVVWHSLAQDGSNYGIFGRRFDASGSPLGGEFQVNTYTTGYQYGPRVASDPTGNFVVVWISLTQDGSSDGISGRRYDSAGVPRGGEFQVNTYTPNAQNDPAIAMDASGRFVVVWTSETQDGDGGGIFGQRFDAAAVRQGPEFRVNTYTTDRQYRPAVATDAGGRFVVVWMSQNQDGDGYGIFGQRYDATGTPQGSEFQANTYTTAGQYRPVVAMRDSGQFVVVWDSFGQDGDRYGVFARHYDSAGVPQGAEFQVNTFTTSAELRPAVASDPVGNFVVVWASESYQDGSASGIFGQRYGGLVPVALAVDAAGNGVLEPGETVIIAPAWRNGTGGPLTFTGAASGLAGPAGATYLLADAAADYGTVANATVGNCGADCFQVSVSNPATRPATHWDVTVLETIGPPALGLTKVWTLHVGNSFPDVPSSNPFYPFVETLLHAGVTAGCTATTYCPDGVTTRDQMAVFLLRAKEGAGYSPPPCTTAPFPDVPCASPFAVWVQELVARGITAGCGGGLYCPTDPVTREQMAVFLLKTKEGAAFAPPPCTTAPFPDVPCASPFAPWVQELVTRGITAGCGGGLYCPANPVTRAQMAVFLVRTFGLTLYGP
jgi:hypothetical protein